MVGSSVFDVANYHSAKKFLGMSACLLVAARRCLAGQFQARAQALASVNYWEGV